MEKKREQKALFLPQKERKKNCQKKEGNLDVFVSRFVTVFPLLWKQQKKKKRTKK